MDSGVGGRKQKVLRAPSEVVRGWGGGDGGAEPAEKVMGHQEKQDAGNQGISSPPPSRCIWALQMHCGWATS